MSTYTVPYLFKVFLTISIALSTPAQNPLGAAKKILISFSFISNKYSSNICGNVSEAKPINITFIITSFKAKNFDKSVAIKYNIAVIIVKGKAFLTNVLTPLEKSILFARRILILYV